jgi:hypothetical protein
MSRAHSADKGRFKSELRATTFRPARAADLGATFRLFAPSPSVDSLSAQTAGKAFDNAAADYAKRLLKEGKQNLSYITFGSEVLRENALRLRRAIVGSPA